MANLNRDQVLQALQALSEADRTYVLAQLASSVSQQLLGLSPTLCVSRWQAPAH